jgi:hypothetical protein
MLYRLNKAMPVRHDTPMGPDNHGRIRAESLGEHLFLMMISHPTTRRRVLAMAEERGIDRAGLRAEVLAYARRLARCDVVAQHDQGRTE